MRRVLPGLPYIRAIRLKTFEAVQIEKAQFLHSAEIRREYPHRYHQWLHPWPPSRKDKDP